MELNVQEKLNSLMKEMILRLNKYTMQENYKKKKLLKY